MNIAGIQKHSFVDFPDHIAAVVFTQGCNFNCYFCHNPHLILPGGSTKQSESQLLHWLQQRKGWLEGLVISGGEPTLQDDLEDFIRKVVRLGYPIKLDTNGSQPDVLARLMDQQLLAYVAMDIKAPLGRYREAAGSNQWNQQIQKSVNLLLSSTINYEFRTTLIPELQRRDIIRIAHLIQGARCYVLQQYRPANSGCSKPLQPEHEKFILSQVEEIRRLGLIEKVIPRGVTRPLL